MSKKTETNFAGRYYIEYTLDGRKDEAIVCAPSLRGALAKFINNYECDSVETARQYTKADEIRIQERQRALQKKRRDKILAHLREITQIASELPGSQRVAIVNSLRSFEHDVLELIV